MTNLHILSRFNRNIYRKTEGRVRSQSPYAPFPAQPKFAIKKGKKLLECVECIQKIWPIRYAQREKYKARVQRGESKGSSEETQVLNGDQTKRRRRHFDKPLKMLEQKNRKK